MAVFNFSSTYIGAMIGDLNSTTNCTIFPETTTEANLKKQQGSVTYTGLVSAETHFAVVKITNYFMYPLTIIGLLLCGFGAVVFTTKRMRSPTSIYLLALNLTEFANILASMVTETSAIIYGDKATSSFIYLTSLMYFSTYFGASIRRTTFCITCLVSAERCIAVVSPLKSKYFKIVRHPVLTIVFVTLSALLFHVFVAMKFELESYQSKDTNETLWKAKLTEVFIVDRPVFDALSIASKVIFVCLPLLGCLIWNFIIVIALRKHTKTRETMIGRDNGKVKNNDLKTTITVLASTFSLVILALPTNITSFIANVVPKLLTKERYLFHMIRRIGALCDLISSCVGFIFYMTLSAEFRKTFFALFCPCRSKKSSTSELRYPTSGSGNTSLSIVEG